MKNAPVTSVTERDNTLNVTRSLHRDKRDTPLWGVTYVTLTQKWEATARGTH